MHDAHEGDFLAFALFVFLIEVFIFYFVEDVAVFALPDFAEFEVREDFFVLFGVIPLNACAFGCGFFPGEGEGVAELQGFADVGVAL